MRLYKRSVVGRIGRNDNTTTMIDYIRGAVAELQATVAVVEACGIGYDINITLIDYPNLQVGSEAKLYVHESIREDAHVLYGFLEKESREIFRLLIGVSGVGPNTARLILSAMTRQQLEDSVAGGNEAALKAVKGVGGKTAQRIIIDLKDKIKVDVQSLSLSMTMGSETYDDSLAALVMLGFSQLQSQKVLKKLFTENPKLTTEQAIKHALTML